MGTSAENRLADWFRRWRSPLRKFLAGKASVRTADLDDIAQEVFLRLLRYEKDEIVEYPQAYLFKMASNVAAEWGIRSRNRLEHEPHWLGELVAEGGPEEAFDTVAVQQEIRRAIFTLNPRERTILRLHFEEGLSYPEIALRLGISLRVVRRDFEKSYGKLRGEIRLQRTGVLSGGEKHRGNF
jgi:RNA polymerase sigma-70 factor (ECF subfamily)